MERTPYTCQAHRDIQCATRCPLAGEIAVFADDHTISGIETAGLEAARESVPSRQRVQNLHAQEIVGRRMAVVSVAAVIHDGIRIERGDPGRLGHDFVIRDDLVKVCAVAGAKRGRRADRHRRVEEQVVIRGRAGLPLIVGHIAAMHGFHVSLNRGAKSAVDTLMLVHQTKRVPDLVTDGPELLIAYQAVGAHAEPTGSATTWHEFDRELFGRRAALRERHPRNLSPGLVHRRQCFHLGRRKCPGGHESGFVRIILAPEAHGQRHLPGNPSVEDARHRLPRAADRLETRPFSPTVAASGREQDQDARRAEACPFHVFSCSSDEK